jgi:hypothetical protein
LPFFSPRLHNNGALPKIESVKFTQYFQTMRQRPDRAGIEMEWIRQVIDRPEKSEL